MDLFFDVAIIGGGINGCGCAADAALRGLSVVLLEQDDIASQTSSSSTKLIHGGLRYLENYEFKLVKKAIQERQRLLDLAPHLVHPQALVLPFEKHMRPSWFLRLGLFVYDNLSRKNCLPPSKMILRKKQRELFAPLKTSQDKGFLFYDALTDDSRLTLVNAIQAKNHGASIRTRSKVIQAEVVNHIWQLKVQPQLGECYIIHAKVVINAAGPWVKSVEQLTQVTHRENISLVKGSHILVPPKYIGNHAYFLQHHDKRVIFVIPYHGFSMIGTTDIPFNGDPNNVAISNEEIEYLLDLVNFYFKHKTHKEDIIDSWSGVRALLSNNEKEARTLSRDYTYNVSLKPSPIITIYGGKITTYRQLAEEVIDQIRPLFPKIKHSLTASSPLPGSGFNGMTFAKYQLYAKEKYKWMDNNLFQHYLSNYGSLMELFLANCTNQESLGKQFCTYLYQIEVDYLIREEWAQNASDILKRRTKLDLVINESGKKALIDYLATASIPAINKYQASFMNDCFI